MKKTLILALAAAGMTVGGAAVAQDQMRGAEMTRADVETRTAARFARMDVNGDGMLNTADREARALERFNEADANGDGALTFEEMQAAREARQANRQERRAERGGERAERGGERAERGERRGGHRDRRGGNRGQMMERADTNGDGSVSQAEFTAAALARFDSADANNDGTVTAEERQAQRAERGGRRGPGRR